MHNVNPGIFCGSDCAIAPFQPTTFFNQTIMALGVIPICPEIYLSLGLSPLGRFSIAEPDFFVLLGYALSG